MIVWLAVLASISYKYNVNIIIVLSSVVITKLIMTTKIWFGREKQKNKESIEIFVSVGMLKEENACWKNICDQLK